MQTRYIAGWTAYWRAPESSALLEIAKRRLREDYEVFGLQDKFQESLERIAGAFSWDIGPNDGKEAKQTVIEKVVTDEDRAAVQRFNRLDVELYDYAQELFRSRGMLR
jgi:hypothetical protein